MEKKVVVEYERKFLVKEIPSDIILDRNNCIEIEQIYLGSKEDKLCVRIRKETINNYSLYYLMMKLLPTYLHKLIRLLYPCFAEVVSHYKSIRHLYPRQICFLFYTKLQVFYHILPNHLLEHYIALMS